MEAYYKMLSIMKIKNIISTICVLKCVINSVDIRKKSRKYRVKCRIEAKTKCRSRKNQKKVTGRIVSSVFEPVEAVDQGSKNFLTSLWRQVIQVSKDSWYEIKMLSSYKFCNTERVWNLTYENKTSTLSPWTMATKNM